MIEEGSSNSERAEEIEELRAELARLRARVARLEEEKAALLAAQSARDYERPPHYQ